MVVPPTISSTGNALDLDIVVHHDKVLDLIQSDDLVVVVVVSTACSSSCVAAQESLKGPFQDQIATLGERGIGKKDAVVVIVVVLYTFLIVRVIKEERVGQSSFTDAESLLQSLVAAGRSLR